MAALLFMVSDSASPNANETRVKTALELQHTVTLISDDATTGPSDLSAYDAGVISENASGTWASNWDLATAGVLVGKSTEPDDYGLANGTGSLASDTQVEAEGTGAVVTDLGWSDGTDYTIFDGARTPTTLLVSDLPAYAVVVALDKATALYAYAVTYEAGGPRVGGGILNGRRAWIGGDTDKRGSTSGDDDLWASLAAYVAGEISPAAVAPTIDVANAVTTAETSGSSHTATLPTVGLVDGDMMVVVGQIGTHTKFWFADDWLTVETPNPGGGSRQILSYRVIDSSVWTPGGSQQFDMDGGTSAARSQAFTVHGGDVDSFLNSNNCDGVLQSTSDPMVLAAGSLTGMGTNSLFLLAWGDESAARSITTLDADLTLIGSVNDYQHLAYEDVVSAGQNSAISTDMSSSRNWDVGYWEIKAAATGSRATLDARVNGAGVTAVYTDTYTQAITLGAGTNRKLVVCVGKESGSVDFTGVTFDGTAVPAPGGNGSPATVGGDVQMVLYEYDIPDAKATGSYDVVIGLTANLRTVSWACWIIKDAATGALEDIQNDGARTTTSILQAQLTNAATSYVGCFVINGAVGPEASFADGNVTGWLDDTGVSQRAFAGDTTSKENALAYWDATSSSNDKVLIAFAVALAPSGGTVHTLAAAADGVATVVTEVSPRRIRSAAIDGTSTVAATMSVVRTVAAAADGAATVSTVITKVVGPTGTVYELAAAADGTATVTTDVSPRRIRSAAVDGSSTVAVQVSPRRIRSATVNGSSTVAALLSVAKVLSAQADGVSTVSAEVSRQAHRSASAAGTSTLAASMSAVRALDAQADGVAAVTTVITHVVPGGTEYNLAAAVDGVASVGAESNVVRALSAQADGTSTVTAVLSAGSVTALTAQVDGSSTVSTALASVRALSASSEGTSTSSGSLDVVRALAALAAGSSTVTASLESGGTTELTALIGGTSTVSADIAPLRIRSAAIDGTSTVSADIAALRIREALAEGVGTLASDLDVVRALSVAADGFATVEVALTHIQLTISVAGKYADEHARGYAKVAAAEAADYASDHARGYADTNKAGI